MVRALIDEIWSFRCDVTNTGSPEDGNAYFECPDQAMDQNLRIWNTAQSVIGLTRLSELSPTKSKLAPFVRWLAYSQNGGPASSDRIRGSWGNDAAQVGGDSLPICTYSAITAIHRAQGPKAPIALGIEWFSRLIRQADGETLPGNTTLCAAAAAHSTVFGEKRFMPSLPLDTILRLVERIELQAQKIQELNDGISRQQQQYLETLDESSKERDGLIISRDKLQEELGGYIIKIRREGLGFWVLISIIISIVTGAFSVAVALILEVIP